MGTIYFVACRDCKVTRNLDKFYSMQSAADRAEALDIAEGIKDRDNFRAALLVSFMWDHRGHNCTVFNEHCEDLCEELWALDSHNSENGMRPDKNFWREHG